MILHAISPRLAISSLFFSSYIYFIYNTPWLSNFISMIQPQSIQRTLFLLFFVLLLADLYS